MNVCEIFKSIQGEGLGIGEVTTFVRFAGCNLQCTFCDTKYAWKESTSMEPRDITRQIRDLACPNICLTGGEPLLQNLTELLWELRMDNVSIETNGTIDPSSERWFGLECIKRWTISPKLTNSGQVHHARMDVVEKIANSKPSNQMKFVVENEADVNEALQFCQKANVKFWVPIVFQPNSSQFVSEAEGKTSILRTAYYEKLNELIEIVKTIRRPNIFVLPQLHFLIWARERKK